MCYETEVMSQYGRDLNLFPSAIKNDPPPRQKYKDAQEITVGARGGFIEGARNTESKNGSGRSLNRCILGADLRTRTADPILTMDVLYLLS